MAGTNYDKLINHIGKEHSPFIVYDVETTGIMNGNDNCITQMALTFYDYNKENGKYELQDELFMLAKPNEEIIRNIQSIDKYRKEHFEEAVTESLKDDYIYSLLKNEINEENKQAIRDSRDNIDERVFNRFCTNYGRYEKKVAEFRNALTIEEILKKQGLDLEKYIKDDLGLTTAEMQVGITEFLNKYCKENTVFVNNGTYFAKHYMDKVGLSFLGKTDEPDKVIDLIQAERSKHGGVSRWTSDIPTFAENYKKETGKEIKTFDALTKALCIGESATKACDMRVSLTSENYLEKKVSESAFSKDNDYVMSLARANTLKWNIASERDFYDADYHFNSLEYVNFGNDRRYVDIDKMFKMNDNFEITLDGEKTPIKTWEELEAKIKSLNAEISDELLDKIHEKYDEITKEADKRWKEDLEIRFNDGTLSANNMTAEEYEYLDSVYDISEERNESIDFNPYDYETRKDAMDSLNMYHAEGLISDDDYKSYVIEIDECEEYKDDEEIEKEPKPLTAEQQAEELLRQYEELNKKKETLDTKITDLTEQNRQFCKKLADVMENLLAKRNEIYENIGWSTTGKDNTLTAFPTEAYGVNFNKIRQNDYKIYLYLRGASDRPIYFNNPKFNEIISKFDIDEEKITNAFWVEMSNDIQRAIKMQSETIESLESKVETMETFKIDKGNKNKSKGEER